MQIALKETYSNTSPSYIIITMPTIANYILSIFTWSRKQFKKYFPGKTETQSPENQTSFRESILEPVKCWITPLWKYKEPSKLQTTVVCPKTSQCLLTFWIHNKSFWITKVTSAKFFLIKQGEDQLFKVFSDLSVSGILPLIQLLSKAVWMNGVWMRIIQFIQW